MKLFFSWLLMIIMDFYIQLSWDVAGKANFVLDIYFGSLNYYIIKPIKKVFFW